MGRRQLMNLPHLGGAHHAESRMPELHSHAGSKEPHFDYVTVPNRTIKLDWDWLRTIHRMTGNEDFAAAEVFEAIRVMASDDFNRRALREVIKEHAFFAGRLEDRAA